MDALTYEFFHKLYVVTSRILIIYLAGYLVKAFPGLYIIEHRFYIGGRNGAGVSLAINA